MHKTGELRM